MHNSFFSRLPLFLVWLHIRDLPFRSNIWWQIRLKETFRARSVFRFDHWLIFLRVLRWCCPSSLDLSLSNVHAWQFVPFPLRFPLFFGSLWFFIFNYDLLLWARLLNANLRSFENCAIQLLFDFLGVHGRKFDVAVAFLGECDNAMVRDIARVR